MHNPGNAICSVSSRHYQTGTGSRLEILTLMMAAISFLITERSRVNLHIYKKEQLSHV